MDKDQIKRQVSMEQLLARYGRIVVAGKKMQCLCPENHNNYDADPSMDLYGDRVFCRSQECFGDKGADIFGVVGLMEGLPNFVEQMNWLVKEFNLSTGQPPQHNRSILRAYEWTDSQGRTAYHLRIHDPNKFIWNQQADGLGDQHLKPCTPDLYQREQVIGAHSVIVCAGERDCDTANRWLKESGQYPEIVTTCNHTGESTIMAESFALLHGKRAVYAIGDNDPTGESYRQKVCGFLQSKVGNLFSVHVPAAFNDITEWAESGATAEAFKQLLNTAEPVKPEAEGNTQTAREEASSAPKGQSRFALTSMSDLLNEPDETTEWLVDQLLPAGGLSVIGGKPKAGKSTTVRNLCLNVARGEPFLGFPTIKGAVIYCAFEEKRGEVKNHFQLLGAVPDDRIYSFIGQAPEDFIEKIRPILTAVQPALMILDTLVKVACVKDMNDYSQVMKAIDPFLHLARQSGAHLMLVHHNGKSDRDGGDNLLGSTAIFGSVDTCLIQKRSDKYRTLQSINPYGKDLEETVIEWDEETRTIALGGSKKDSEVGRFREEIMAFLKTQEEPATRELLEESVEGRTGVKREALKNLVESKAVERQGKGGKGDPFKYSCFVVPPILREQGNNNTKNPQNGYEQRTDSCSRDSGFVAPCPDLREQACMRSEKEVFDLDS